MRVLLRSMTPSINRASRHAVALLLLLLLPSAAAAQANGQLQIHFIKVGQGDAALIVSPLGETMLIDSGPESAASCASATGIVTYLTSIGLTKLDYHVASHYDADHIGCSEQIAARWPIQKVAYDRGQANAPTTIQYSQYAAAVASRRQTVSVGQNIVLDATSSVPVVFQVVAVNANGFAVSDENDRAVVLVLRFGAFDAEFGGDISSVMERRIASTVGPVELHKVHHHGSATSSSAEFLAATRPRVAVLSVGSPNAYNHPTATALTNIHNIAATTTYWTTPGDGAAPQPVRDIVANGAVVVGVFPGAATFTVNAAGGSTPYALLDTPGCSYAVAGPSSTVPAQGLTSTATVTTAAGCAWTASSSDPSWLTLSPRSGIGSGTVTIAVPPNASRVVRSAFMSIAGNNFSVVQRGRAAAAGDFDGDGKSDITVFRPSTGIWYVRNIATGLYDFYQWGLDGDIPVPGDYDGDGEADIAVYRPSTGIWYIRNSSDGSQGFLQWGLSGDIPVPGDYDGDGKTDAAVFRPSTGIWYVRDLATNTASFYQWGLSDDVPVAADYDGDGKTDVAVWRPTTGIWYIRNSSDGSQSFLQWGLNGDIPVPGDYDGDGKADSAVFRPSTGIWYVRDLVTNTASFYQWGLQGDSPVEGDFDGDGKTDIAVFRPSTGIWYVRGSSNGGGGFYQWGITGDVPIVVRQ